MSGMAAAFVDIQPQSTSYDRMPTVAVFISSAVMQSGMSMHDSIALL